MWCGEGNFQRVLEVGPIITYVGPLVFVLSCTLLKEAVDDIKRHKRDREQNDETYKRLSPGAEGTGSRLAEVKAADIRVGDIIQVAAASFVVLVRLKPVCSAGSVTEPVELTLSKKLFRPD